MSLAYAVLWGLVATVAMTAVLRASQGFGWSRLSLPLLVGTFFTGQRDRAVVWGYLLYVIGGLFLLVCALPLLPFVHPRMASEYHGVTAQRQLEPPGFMAVNYGYGTPLTMLAAQAVYGAVLGAFVQLAN
jgi:hypothetical protein